MMPEKKRASSFHTSFSDDFYYIVSLVKSSLHAACCFYFRIFLGGIGYVLKLLKPEIT